MTGLYAFLRLTFDGTQCNVVPKIEIQARERKKETERDREGKREGKREWKREKEEEREK